MTAELGRLPKERATARLVPHSRCSRLNGFFRIYREPALPVCVTTPRRPVIQRKACTMLKWALIFFIVSIIAGVFGFTGISAATAGIARILFFLFIVIFLVFLVLSLMAGNAIL
jgi:uncharacterized membrane protein YtjA (UPF0391 family)